MNEPGMNEPDMNTTLATDYPDSTEADAPDTWAEDVVDLDDVDRKELIDGVVMASISDDAVVRFETFAAPEVPLAEMWSHGGRPRVGGPSG